MLNHGFQHSFGESAAFGLVPAVPFLYNTINRVTNAMIYLSLYGYGRNIIHVKDINRIAKM